MKDQKLTIQEEKHKLRLEIKKRLQLLQYPYTSTSLAVYDNLCKALNFNNVQTVATYVDFSRELPTLPFLPRLFDKVTLTGNSTSLIAVPFCKGNRMEFYRLNSPVLNEDHQPCFSDLAPGKYGILEPLPQLRECPQSIVDPQSIEIMLTPGLAFDPSGRRLGRGAGYYDRYLTLTSPDMLIIALAFDCQIVEEVPAEEFDVTVDAVITPTQIISISNKFQTGKFTNQP